MSKLLETDINEQLLKILGKFDLKFNKIEDFYFVDEKFPGITGQVFEMERYDDSVIIQLDVHILLPNQNIIESFIGHASSVEEAIAEALEQFEVNVVHVFISAFWENAKKIENGVGLEQWEINGYRWQAVVGNYGYKGNLPIEEIVLDEMFETIKDEIHSLPLEQDIYAIRSVYTNVGDGRKVTEALLNNEEFPSLENKISRLPWKNVDEYYSVRNLILVMKLNLK
ncbi:MAG: hypothetical protein DSZ07_00765 [Sulfurovum sp.]|nr:MAG: hypothetical protein DSZ07_00765 [Sulfurovum sp.]